LRLAFLEADDGVFRENDEVSADLCFVAFDASGEVTN
jgi:hypothetical protein